MEHVISDEAFSVAVSSVSQGFTWFVYNTSPYFLAEEDVRFFRTEKQALDWAREQSSDTAAFKVIRISSLIDLYKEISYGEGLKNIFNQPKNNFMNQQNLDYLKDNLRFMGFADKLHADLEKNIQQGFPEFVLKMDSDFNGKKMDSTLYFKRSDQTDLYFFNRFDAHLHHPKDPEKDRQQIFYLNKGHGVTLKEAFNLLEGRAVHKQMSNREGEKFQAWIQLDFKQKEENGNYKTKQYHEHYGYDLASSLKNFPIKELQNDQQRERLMMSLEKGNVQSVTMTAGGREQLFFIEANPQYKTISVYDAHMKMLSKEQRTEITEKTGMVREQAADDEKKTEVQNKQEGKEQLSTAAKKSETPGSEKENSKTEKAGLSSSRKAAKAGKDEVKNLLPQNKDGSSKKGLRA